jgi:uncharacterized membrane protein
MGRYALSAKASFAMKRLITAWLVTALVFVGLDAIWLTQVSPRFYPPIIGDILSSTIEPVPAFAFYLIFVTGIVALAVLPSTSAKGAAARGAMLGLVAYATYDLTNQATLRVWSTLITLADLTWGALISACAAAAAQVFARRSS